MHHLLTAAALLSVVLARSVEDDRAEQLKRMKQYETGYLQPVVVDENTMALDFDAFGQHYSISLERQILAAPSNVVHSNVAEEVHSAVSSRSSCQWQGAVLNFEGVSVVSASFCEGRGIRARVAAFDEILVIKPAAYYLDVAVDAMASHSLSDEVLMYRLSDFERPQIMGTEGVSDYVTMDDVDAMSNGEGEAIRRRLYSSSSPGNTELTILIGPVRIANYQTTYGTNWYSNLYYDTEDMINAVDAIYEKTNWNANGRSSVGYAGSLRVRFNEIHLIFAFTGNYASMAPRKRFSNCPLPSGEYDDSDSCAIVGNEWLGKISSWVYYNLDSANYDNVQFITDIKFNWNSCTSSSGATYVCSRTLGWGNIGVVCKGSSSVSTNSVVPEFGGNDLAIGTIAHELGHNFGLYHDGQSGPAASCGANDGLMGYGNNHEEFSVCSLNSMEDYFDGDGNGMQCLATGWSSSDGVTSNYGGGDSGEPLTPSPVSSPANTPSPVSSSSNADCVHIEVGFTNIDGDWHAFEDTEYNGANAYYLYTTIGYYYLYKKEITWWNVEMKWIVVDSWDSNPSVYFFCTEDDLMDCGGGWKSWSGDSDGYYTKYSSSTISEDCSSSMNVDQSCASFDCLYVTGTGSFDGYYDATEHCHDDQRVFSNSNGEYLCYNNDYRRWFFGEYEDSECSLGTVISAETDGDALSAGYWLLSSGGSTGYTYSTGVFVSDCSADAGFTGLECLENNEYGEEICVSSSSGSTLLGADRTFSVYDELCANDRPVYHLTVYNESKVIVFAGAVLSEGVEATLFLHFQPLKLFSTDSEETPFWMVTRDEISVNYLARCSAEDLMECTASRWEVRVTDYNETQHFNRSMGGLIEFLVDDKMAVTNGGCSAQREDDGASTAKAAVVAAVVIALVALLCIVAFCVWRRRKENESLRHQQQVQGLPTGTGAEEAEPVEEAGDHVTTTHD